MRHKRKILFFFLALVFLLLFFSRYFQVKQITVTGCNYYTEEEIKEKVAGGFWGSNSLLLYLKHKYMEEDPVPFIEELEITMISRSEVHITVYEKAMIACVKYMNEYLYFDQDGIVVESSPEKIEGLPLITGVNFDRMILYEPMAVEDPLIFNKILELSQLMSHYDIRPDRIAFNVKQEAALYVGEIKVLLGKRDQYAEQIAELSGILEKAQKEKLKGTLHMETYQVGQEKTYFDPD